ncbi:MAG: L,D-transpeptidase [Vallitaleaceae bacterium]|nr:L,D-transpeptidase [Vallitaleaceae bacterium]
MRIPYAYVPWGKYAIHGTDEPWSIGSSLSKGCIRMYSEDAAEL